MPIPPRLPGLGTTRLPGVGTTRLPGVGTTRLPGVGTTRLPGVGSTPRERSRATRAKATGGTSAGRLRVGQAETGTPPRDGTAIRTLDAMFI
jgi:hypothetical protein